MINDLSSDIKILQKIKFSGNGGSGALIDDNNISKETVYSSNKTQEELDKIEGLATHSNRDVLDLLTSDGNELFFNGMSVHKIELPDGQTRYSGTFMNVIANTDYGINIEKGSKLCDQIVQVWEFEEGGTDITTVAKTFNNHTSENFFYDSENIEFTDDVCKIKDGFVLDNTLNETTGFYETKLNRSEFIELVSLESEVD